MCYVRKCYVARAYSLEQHNSRRAHAELCHASSTESVSQNAIHNFFTILPTDKSESRANFAHGVCQNVALAHSDAHTIGHTSTLALSY